MGSLVDNPNENGDVHKSCVAEPCRTSLSLPLESMLCPL